MPRLLLLPAILLLGDIVSIVFMLQLHMVHCITIFCFVLCVLACKCACMRACVRACVLSVPGDTHTHTHTHTYTHTHTHTPFAYLREICLHTAMNFVPTTLTLRLLLLKIHWQFKLCNCASHQERWLRADICCAV